MPSSYTAEESAADEGEPAKEVMSGGRKSSKEKDTGWLMLGILVLLGSLLLPVPKGESLSLDCDGKVTLPTICWLKRTTGIDCTGCGLTRSFVAMGHLNFKKAWGFHRVGPLLYVAVLFQIPYRLTHILAERKGRRLRRFHPRLTKGILYTTWILIVANWVYNLATGAAFH